MDTSTVLYNTDTSLLWTVCLVPEMPKIITYTPYLYNTETSVKRALGYVLLVSVLQSNQVKRTPQEYINEFIIQKLNPLLVVDFRLISVFLHV